MFLGSDKNIKQIRTTVAAKSLATLLGVMNPPKSFVHRKTDGSVSVDYRRVARVVVSPDGTQLKFNMPVVEDLGCGFDKSEVKRQWAFDSKGGAATWSFATA